jgi:gliding motility-associated-like protein
MLSIKNKIYLFGLLIILFTPTIVSSQVIFNNPSFEGRSGANISPPLWSICSGTPDILPHFLPIFPSHGNSCIGMVHRGLSVREELGQQLPRTLDSTKCYSFSIDLRNGIDYGLNYQPGRLAVWFGDSLCSKKFLAWTSPVVTSAVFRTYSVFFQPNKNYTHTTFEIQRTSSSVLETGIVMDNIHNEIISTSVVDLGLDKLLCFGDSLLLDATGNNLTYLWQDGSMDSLLLVSKPGLYAITVTDINGCQKKDEILISYPDTLELGNNLIFCDGDSVLLETKFNSGTFLWQDGSSDSSLYAIDSGMYRVTVTNQNCIQTDSILVSINEKIPFSLGTDTILCFGDTLLLDVTTNGASYLWQNNSTGSKFTVRNSGLFSVRVKQGDCFYFDTLNVVYDNPTPVDLGSNRTMCIGDSVLLSINNINGSTILWSTNEQTNSIWARQDGVYWVESRVGSCSVSDTIRINYQNSQRITIDLGNKSVLCPGLPIILDVTHPNASYLWQDQSSLSNLSVIKEGLYKVTVSESGCSDSASIFISSIDTLNLGMDTIICTSENLFLDAFIPNSVFQWSNGQSTNSVLSIDSGLYAVTVNTNSCFQTDSIQISFYERPRFSLGNDTVICAPDSLLLDVFVQNSTYLWQDGSLTSKYTAKESGLYFVDLENNNCIYRDSIIINNKDLQFSLGNDTILCLLDSLVLEVFPNPNANLLWNNGFTTNSLIVKQSGMYWAKISEDICEKSDSIIVSYTNNLRPTINLGNDTTLCLSDSISLDATWLSSSLYVWQNNTTNNTLNVNKPGVYSVTVSDGICDGTDEINISYVDSVDLSFPGNTFCIDEGTLVEFNTPLATYIWQDSSVNSSYYIQDTGQYWVEMTLNDCKYLSDSIYFFEKDCDCLIELPNVFSPNDDGINDLFFIETDCSLKEFKFLIYNRYGQNLIESTNPKFQWDGRIQGEKVNNGVYFYYVSYVSDNNEKQEYYGSLSILR